MTWHDSQLIWRIIVMNLHMRETARGSGYVACCNSIICRGLEAVVLIRGQRLGPRLTAAIAGPKAGRSDIDLESRGYLKF
jgi:hypothetical protein